MIPLSIGVVLGLASTAMSQTDSRRMFVFASLLRVVALAGISWWLLLGPQGGSVTWPIVAFGVISLSWTTLIGAAWPDYAAAHRSTLGPDRKPDRKAMPLLVSLALGWPLSAVAFALASWLFLTDFQRLIDASGVGFGYSTRAALASVLGMSALIALSGMLALIIGRRRNPWYPAQRAYLSAATRRGDERSKAMLQAVSMIPSDEQPAGSRPRA